MSGSGRDTDRHSISDMFRIQRSFSDIFFDSSKLTLEEREQMTKSFALSLHNEVSSLVQEINFKDHVMERKDVIKNSLLYEGVDVFRYLLAIMNLWEFSSDEFLDAFDDKENFLRVRRYLETRVWNGEDVVVFDMDDVIVEFRDPFAKWLYDKKGINANVNSSEYYLINDISSAGYSSERLFDEFTAGRGFRNLPIIEGILDVMNELKRMGLWIHIVTSRPFDNLVCRYDTYTWLRDNNVPFDGIGFSPEKISYLSKLDFFNTGKIVCAIDDSAKHCSEFLKHGIDVIYPVKSYNKELVVHDNAMQYNNSKEILGIISGMINRRRDASGQ